MIPPPPGFPDRPDLPDLPAPHRAAPPAATSWLGLLEDLQRKVEEMEKRLDGLEERMRAVEGHPQM